MARRTFGTSRSIKASIRLATAFFQPGNAAMYAFTAASPSGTLVGGWRRAGAAFFAVLGLAMPGGIGTGALSISSGHVLDAMPWLRAIQRLPTQCGAPL